MPTTGSDMTTERGNLSVGQQKGQGIMEPILGYARRHGVGVEANVRVARGNLRVSIGSGHSWSWPLHEVDVLDKGNHLELYLGDRTIEFIPAEPNRFRREVVTAVVTARCLASLRPAGWTDDEGTGARCDDGHDWREVYLPDDVPRRVCAACGHLVIDLTTDARAPV